MVSAAFFIIDPVLYS